MTTVRITETYDLCTRIGKLGMIGIHTPSTGTIKALYPGLWDSHKFVRMRKCDITIACASMLPADPLQVGTEAGSIAPQDMFNPILYRAVTNESFDVIMGRLNAMVSSPTNASGFSINSSPEVFGTVTDSQKAYYSLLSERGWRKSMPQAGLSMRGLVPLVYPLLTAFGNEAGPLGLTQFSQAIPGTADSGEIASMAYKSALIRGKPVRMPRFPTKCGDRATDVYSPVDTAVPNAMVACIVMPPSKLHSLYYRLRVSWSVSFEHVRSTNEYGSLADIISNAGVLYNEYMPSQSSKDMEKDESMVATNDMDMELIMQSGM